MSGKNRQKGNMVLNLFFPCSMSRPIDTSTIQVAYMWVIWTVHQGGAHDERNGLSGQFIKGGPMMREMVKTTF